MSLALLVVVGHSIYNRYFHPLRIQPGPVCASLTNFYKLYAPSAKHIPTLQLALHRKHGLLFFFSKQPRYAC